jgi:hypothetical protein
MTVAKVTFTDQEREAAKASGSMLFAVFVQPPTNSNPDQGATYRSGTLTPTQAEDLADALAATLRKFRQTTP